MELSGNLCTEHYANNSSYFIFGLLYIPKNNNNKNIQGWQPQTNFFSEKMGS